MATTMMFSGGRVRSGHIAELYYTDERGDRRQVILDKDYFTIGRSRDNDLSIDNPELSRYHAEIVVDGDEFIFLDRNSLQGCFYADQRVLERALHDGDSIRLGSGRKSLVLTFVRVQAENPCLIPELSDTLFMEQGISDQVSVAPLVAGLQSIPSIISLRHLTSITEQLRECHTPAEVYQVLHNSLDFVFPATQVRVSDVEHPPTARKHSVSGPLVGGPQVHGYFSVSGNGRAFTGDEADFIRALAGQAGQALEMVRLKQEQKRSFDSLIKALALALDARDEMTAGHSARVANYSRAISRHMGMSHAEQDLIYYAALLHDYGKIGIRDEVLCKPSGLTPEEYEHIKQHPSFTFHILSRINFGPEMAGIPLIASTHHERPDGRGYPRGLKGDEIHIGALIIGVADFFDALTVKRHYRLPMPIEDVLTLIEAGRDTQFDGRVIDAFKRYYEIEYRPRRIRSQQHRMDTAENTTPQSAPVPEQATPAWGGDPQMILRQAAD